MIAGTVNYKDVGLEKASGSAHIEAKTVIEFNNLLEDLFRCFLLSSDVSFSKGVIYVGGFRKVGTFTLDMTDRTEVKI